MHMESMTPSFKVHARAFTILWFFSMSVCPNSACACINESTVDLQIKLAFETSKVSLQCNCIYCTLRSSHNQIKFDALRVSWTDQLDITYCHCHGPFIHKTLTNIEWIEVARGILTDIGHFKHIP